ncbi:SDR family oxidoreductase [Methylobacterium sp. 092160098-2]|uniref:SDR family oxidoreductase n=1 Tax=Methylobacterium sp. 092160098-2 TaxID=3025129 RepID=UPI00406C92CC
MGGRGRGRHPHRRRHRAPHRQQPLRRHPQNYRRLSPAITAVEALGRGLALELAPVRANIVAPGIIRTSHWDRLPEQDREAFFADSGAALPAGRIGVAEDVAETYLTHMRSPFTTGQTIVVDGGMLLV